MTPERPRPYASRSTDPRPGRLSRGRPRPSESGRGLLALFDWMSGRPPWRLNFRPHPAPAVGNGDEIAAIALADTISQPPTWTHTRVAVRPAVLPPAPTSSERSRPPLPNPARTAPPPRPRTAAPPSPPSPPSTAGTSRPGCSAGRVGRWAPSSTTRRSPHLPFLITGDADQTNGFFPLARNLLGIGAPRVRPDEPLLVDGQMALTYDAPLSPSARPRRTPPRASASPPPDRTTCQAAAPPAPADHPPWRGRIDPDHVLPRRRPGGAAAAVSDGGAPSAPRPAPPATGAARAVGSPGAASAWARAPCRCRSPTCRGRSAPCSSLPRKGGNDQNAIAVARAAYNERATAPRAPAERETAERDAIARGVLPARR